MQIELQEVPIREVVNGYLNSDEEGVVGYGGKLNIRPKYQREFVYKDKQREAVVETVNKNFPLNVMYWVKNSDESYEVLDGQQRTISICEYVSGKFSVNFQYFHNLEASEQNKILDYKIMVYFCEGTDKEKLDWFETINIAGEKLTDQELRNAIYTGTWLTDAKKYFSKTGCVAYQIGSDYMKGTPNRQDYLETVIKWISNNEIKDYMSKHQHEHTAIELWNYYSNVISWVQSVFKIVRKKEMNGLEWGFFYNTHKDKKLDPVDIEVEIAILMKDDEVKNKKGIYAFILTRNEKYLSLRSFDDSVKRAVYERQKGICPHCPPETNYHEIVNMEADHIIPWYKGGKTTIENCQMLCMSCNRTKSGK